MSLSVAEPAAPAESGAAPDAGDGSQPSDEGIETSAPNASGVAGDGAGPDDEDEDDYSDVPFNQHPRFKALTRKLQKKERQLTTLRSLAERVKDLDVDELKTKARVHDQLQELIAQDEKLRAELMTAMGRGGARKPQPKDDEPDVDPESLPFDTSDENGKFFLNLVKKVNQLERLHARQQQQEQVQREVMTQRQWRSVTVAAAQQIPEAYRDMFSDAVLGAYQDAKARGINIDPQRVIDHYLSKLGVNRGTQGKASAAAAQRIAQNNQKLPQQPAHAGAAAPAKGDRKETVADVSRRLRGMFTR